MQRKKKKKKKKKVSRKKFFSRSAQLQLILQTSKTRISSGSSDVQGTMLVPEFEVLILLILASAIVGMISSTRARDERIWLNTLISSEPFPSLPIFP
jgi:hypothetical protein